MHEHSFQSLYQRRIANSTRPFNARGGRTDRCPRCQVSKIYCICSAKPIARNELAALLLFSESEVLKPSNTGRLIGDTIANTYAFQWSRTEPDTQMLALLKHPDYFPLLLFPQQYVDDRQRLVSQPLPDIGNKKLLLILLDGSWREARRIFRQSPYLNSIPVLSIQPQQLSQYLLRSSENPSHLSTAEVATLAFSQLGYTQSANALLLWFEAFREAYLLSKSQGQGDISRSALRNMMKFQTETADADGGKEN